MTSELPPGTRPPFARAMGDCVASAIIALFVGTIVGSVLLALGIALFSQQRVPDEAWWMVAGFAFVLMMPAFLVCAPVTFFVGLPAYAWARSHGRANAATVLAIVAVVAVGAGIVVDTSLGVPVFLYGSCIGLITHALQRQHDRRA